MGLRASFARRPIDDRHRVSSFYWGDEASRECAQHARDILANLNRGALVGKTLRAVRFPGVVPAVEHDPRAAAVRVQRQITSGRRPLPVGRLTVQPHGGSVQSAGEGIYQHGDAGEELRIADLGTTRDAHVARSLEPQLHIDLAVVSPDPLMGPKPPPKLRFEPTIVPSSRTA